MVQHTGSSPTPNCWMWDSASQELSRVTSPKKVPRRPVDLRVDDGRLHRAFEACSRADAEHVVGIALAVNFWPARRPGYAGHEAHPHQHAPRLVIADGVDPRSRHQRADRPRVEQQHAILVEPDLAFVHVEAQARAQVELLINL